MMINQGYNNNNDPHQEMLVVVVDQEEGQEYNRTDDIATAIPASFPSPPSSARHPIGTWNNEGVELLDDGDIHDALSCFRHALEQCHQGANHEAAAMMTTNWTSMVAATSAPPPPSGVLELGLAERDVLPLGSSFEPKHEHEEMEVDEETAIRQILEAEDDDEDNEKRIRIIPSHPIFTRALTIRHIATEQPVPNITSLSSSNNSRSIPAPRPTPPSHYLRHHETIHSDIVIFNMAITYHVLALKQQQQQQVQQQQEQDPSYVRSMFYETLQQCFNLYQTSWRLLCDGLADAYSSIDVRNDVSSLSSSSKQQQQQQQVEGGTSMISSMTGNIILDIMAMAIWNNMGFVCYELGDYHESRRCFSELLILITRGPSRDSIPTITTTTTTTMDNSSTGTTPHHHDLLQSAERVLLTPSSSLEDIHANLFMNALTLGGNRNRVAPAA